MNSLRKIIDTYGFDIVVELLKIKKALKFSTQWNKVSWKIGEFFFQFRYHY